MIDPCRASWTLPPGWKHELGQEGQQTGRGHGPDQVEVQVPVDNEWKVWKWGPDIASSVVKAAPRYGPLVEGAALSYQGGLHNNGQRRR